MSVNTEQKVNFLHSLEEGLSQAKQTGKNLLFDFFNPG